MKNLFRKWPGLTGIIAIAATTLNAAVTLPQVRTIGGGPNSAGPSRSGSLNGDTFSVAKFNNPYAVAVGQGDLFIADRSNNKIRRVTNLGEPGSLTSTFASKLPTPVGVAVNSTGGVFVVTMGDGRLRVFNNAGTLLRTVSGLARPTALALDLAGNVYVTELGGNLQVIAPDDSITLVASGFRKPQGLALMRNGFLAVSDTGNNAIVAVNPTTGATTLLAGNNGSGFSDGPGSAAKFNKPFGLAVAPNGSLVVADRKNNRVRVVNSSNEVTTLYGVSRSQWVNPFPGWVDGDGGPNGHAAANDPVGVAVGNNGAVYVTELVWDILRKVTSTGLVGANTGNTTNVVVEGTNSTVVVGTNVISLGFESGEGSSDYIAAAGQHYYIPVTLAVAPGQFCYSFQMGLTSTGETGVALSPFDVRFESMLMKPTTNTGVYIPIEPNFLFTNSSLNLLGVGWLERKGQTNLYPANAQDLITTSIAKDTGFGKATGKVILGTYRVVIPSDAPDASTFLVAIRNPSGTTDGIRDPLPLLIPTDGPLGAGAVNTIKRLSLASRQYVVGDVLPFRWFNAGEFGDGWLVNSDVMNLFGSVVYSLNTPVFDSDLFDAMDSSNGTGDYDFGDSVAIDSITTGDGSLNVDDLWVTFRRSIDPSRKWFARYWEGGVRKVVEVPNRLTGGFGADVKAKLVSGSKSLNRPTATVTVEDKLVSAGEAVELPVRVSLPDGYPIRTMLVNVTVEPLDGSPALTASMEFKALAFGEPEFSSSRSAGNYAAAWLDAGIAGVSGNSVLAFIKFNVPASAGSRAGYRVHFDHFSATVNGVALFKANVSSGLVLLSDRSASTWEDGISDAWRLRYFGSIYNPDSAPGADADADGVVNAIENQNGTDPTDATSY
jgi:hypothetical protein